MICYLVLVLTLLCPLRGQILLPILAGGSASSNPPVALLTHACAASSNTNTATTAAIDTTGASLLIVVISDYAAGVTQAAPSDSKSNTWSNLTTQTSSTVTRMRISYVANPTGGTGHTFAATGTTDYPTICVAAFSHVATTSPFDVQNGSNSGSGSVTTLQPGSVTPGANAELLVTGLSFAVSGTASIDSGFTITDQSNYMAGAAIGGAMAYKVQTTAAAVNPTWTAGAASELSATIATFKNGP